MFLPDRRIFFVFLVLLACALFFPSSVHAGISSCSATRDLDSVVANSNNSFSFRITNGDESSGVVWMRVTVPSGNFTFSGSPSTPGWTSSFSETEFTIVGGSLPPNNTATVSIQASSANVDATAADWEIQVSDAENGVDAINCTGSLGTAITGADTSDRNAPALDSLVVTDITDSGVRISWTSDESGSSEVSYGTTIDYGSGGTGESGTNHSVTLTGLSANTTYHYNAFTTDASGNTGESGDNTFSTAKSGYTGTSVTGTVTTVTRIVGPSPTPTPIPDRTPPSVMFTTKFSKFYTTPPEITGRVTDPSGVGSVEYSLDNGQNFLPVDGLSTIGKTSIAFRFIPYQTDDGNYTLVLRTTDLKGNSGSTKGISLVLDRLPPVFGAFMLSSGPLIMDPVGQSMEVVSGIPYVFTVSAVGGPIQASMTLTPVANTRSAPEVFTLHKNEDTGLWTGKFTPTTAGTYTISVDARDGADNMTKRDLGDLLVGPGSNIVNREGNPVSSSVTVYYKDRETGRFAVWDGASYGQKHPVEVSPDGRFSLLLPPGTYYLKIRSPAYQTVVSSLFTRTRTGTITQEFILEHARALKIGSWVVPLPDFRQQTVDIRIPPEVNTKSGSSHILLDTAVPFFRFPFQTSYVSTLDLRGKPSVLVFLNSWSPVSPVQLKELSVLAVHPELNVLAIMPEESVASVNTYVKRGGYGIKILADPDGTLVAPFSISTTPTVFILDRKGYVRSVYHGLVTSQKILDEILD